MADDEQGTPDPVAVPPGVCPRCAFWKPKLEEARELIETLRRNNKAYAREHRKLHAERIRLLNTIERHERRPRVRGVA